MEFIKIGIASLKFPMRLRKAIYLYYLKKTFFIKHSETDKNMKRLVLAIMKAKGSIDHYDVHQIDVTISIQNKATKIPLRNVPFSDVGILYEFIILNEYDDLFSRTQRTYSNQKSINIIDAGSNIGLFTVFAKAHFPNSKIILVEPDQEGIAQFKKISNGLKLDSYKIYNNGLLDESEAKIDLEQGLRGEGNAGFVVTKSTSQSTLTSVNLSTIAQKEELDTVDILKIDIEGSEQDVIMGKHFDEALAQKIGYIAIEIHDDLVNRNLIEERLHALNFAKVAAGRVDIFANKRLLDKEVS